MTYSRHGAAGVGIEFHEQDLLFAIKHGLSGEENVGSEDAVEFLLVKFTRGAGWSWSTRSRRRTTRVRQR